ncbi:4,5-9,10-diseco-3-hydroxy-5,9,17-trioxoandrosta-1(10),2-diene-4-oate hydrolase [Clostridia bacterium]|nr:4,5-9,10-diseco-3-hydroxy-5,9,17-trioxoandrosta-1(10),2-diene-4-oate hydrolase [Clostridia bacterium]
MNGNTENDKTFTIDGRAVNYVIAGDPSLPKLILLQGWGTNIAVYMVVIRWLSERYQVFMPEFPGFGTSEEPDAAFSVDDYADFVIKFMDKIGITNSTDTGKCAVFAHSHGCRVAIKLLSGGHKARFGKAVFTGAAGVVHKRTFKQNLGSAVFKIGKFMLRNNPKQLELYRNRHGSPDYRAASPVMRESLVKIVNEDLRQYMPQITSAVLLIWGTHDNETPIGDGKIMAELIPNAGLAPIAGAGHYAFLDSCALFNEIMNKFV